MSVSGKVLGVETIDTATGEVRELRVFVPKVPHPYAEDWYQQCQTPLLELAKHPQMKLNAWKVWAALTSGLEFKNRLVVVQANIGRELGIDRAGISRAFRTLRDIGVIVEAGKCGVQTMWCLNPQFGWKGKKRDFENFSKVVQARTISNSVVRKEKTIDV